MSEDRISAAEAVVRALWAQGVRRVFGLQGGHIQPIWDALARAGVAIVDVRDEGAAVHMAHAHAVLSGELGVALVTAGPGVSNCVSAIANADLERAPVLLIGGCAPRPQADLGPLQGIDQVGLMRPLCREARTLGWADNLPRDLEQAIANALGLASPPGPVFVEIPTDVLRETVAPALLEARQRPQAPYRPAPEPGAIERAAELLGAGGRLLLISGRGARGAGEPLCALLEASGALYLDTQESRALLPGDHPALATAVRGRAMAEAQTVVVIGRRLDYQLGYGSPAAFPAARRWVRIGAHPLELRDNRRGAVEICADPGAAMAALAAALTARGAGAGDRGWCAALNAEHRRRSAARAARLARAPAGADGYMHPDRLFAALREVMDEDAIAIADGGDILSFARAGLPPGDYLDAGAFGCLGVGVPFAVAAALAAPGRQVISINGDGAFGINAMEIDTAVRHGARAVFVVANNGAWNIERSDQLHNYGGRVVGTELRRSDYAAMARALGLHAERVDDPARLAGALREALAKAPALLDVQLSREPLSSDAGKGLGAVPDYQALDAWDAAERERRGLR